MTSLRSRFGVSILLTVNRLPQWISLLKDTFILLVLEYITNRLQMLLTFSITSILTCLSHYLPHMLVTRLELNTQALAYFTNITILSHYFRALHSPCTNPLHLRHSTFTTQPPQPPHISDNPSMSPASPSSSFQKWTPSPAPHPSGELTRRQAYAFSTRI